MTGGYNSGGVGKALQDHSAGAQESLLPLPFLLDAQQNVSFQDPKRNEALNGSGFFQLLPPELRRMILIHAFGDRTFHMHLEMNHPLRPGLPPPSSHGGVSVPWETCSNVPGRENRDISKPKEWHGVAAFVIGANLWAGH